MTTEQTHIPRPGYTYGISGQAYCGRYAHYGTADHALMRQQARAAIQDTDAAVDYLRSIGASVIGSASRDGMSQWIVTCPSIEGMEKPKTLTSERMLNLARGHYATYGTSREAEEAGE